MGAFPLALGTRDTRERQAVMSRVNRELETDARAWVRHTWKGGLHFIEHAIGGTTGMSDAQLLQPRRITPCELKKGDVKKGGFTFELRSGQRDYHRECFIYGIGTIFLMLVQGNMFGSVGPRVWNHSENVWPANMWSPIRTHADIERLIEAAWLMANRPALVRSTGG